MLSLEAAALYVNQVRALYTNQEDGGFQKWSQMREKKFSYIINVCVLVGKKEKKKSTLAGCQQLKNKIK